MNFTQEFLDELRGRITLSELVGRRVALKRKGHESLGLCPFHNEKSPSFSVSDRKGFFHCFGCGEHGDAIGFTMKTEGLSFPDAVQKLAQEAGLPLPVSTPAERERREQGDDLRRTIELARAWFEKQLRLPHGKPALDYLHGRGLDDAAIEKFRLGFAPDNREALIAALRREDVSEDAIVLAGLAIRPEDGREPYDRFRGRVIFPIADRRGRCIAFGGRILAAGEPKYLNSPETPLFHKGNNLYCLDRAREAAYAGRPVIVAEGYMDVITLHLAGFDGAVAPLGTALTEGQLAELWKIADEPLLCFDGDNAGRRAAFRAAERALPVLVPGKSLRFVSLPPGEDPDTLIRGQGKEAMSGLLAAARPLADVIWELETTGQQLDTPERRAKVRAALRKRASEIRDETVRELYRHELDRRAEAAFLPPGQARQAFLPGAKRRPGPGPQPAAAFPSGVAVRRAGHDLDPSRRERVLLGLPILRPDLLSDLIDDIARLELSRADSEKLRAALLGYASTVHGEAGEASDSSLDRTALARHLEHQRVDAVAQAAEREAVQWAKASGGDENAAALVARWRDTAAIQESVVANPKEVHRAEQAWIEDPTDDNFERLREIKEQFFRAQSRA